MLQKQLRRLTRKARVKSQIHGTAAKPRLSVFKSNTNIYAQLIDDDAGKTICSASDLKIDSGTRIERAQQVGENIAKLAKDAKISDVVFDRGGFLYHGRIKTLADAAREAGLTF